MIKFAILGSGSGGLFQELVYRNVLNEANVSIVIADRSDAKIVDKAGLYSMPSTRLLHRPGEAREEFDERLQGLLELWKPSYILLIGFKRILSKGLVDRYPRRILNLHPALLPAFQGFDPQIRALQHGVKYTGCTVHFVDEGVDTGPIIAQGVVPVLPDDDLDTLLKRMRPVEVATYEEAIQTLVKQKESKL